MLYLIGAKFEHKSGNIKNCGSQYCDCALNLESEEI